MSGSDPLHLTVSGSHLFFTANTPDIGRELWAVALAPASLPCVGDCNSNGHVTIDELLEGVNIALGNVQLSECGSFDKSGAGSVTIDELLAAVVGALSGCGA